MFRALLYALLLPATAFAQASHGGITGLVTDAAQARIPGVTVTAANVATGVVSTATSNSEGNYLLQGLIPGSYRVQAGAQGFKRYEHDAVEVRVGDMLSLPIQLQLGDASERITVSGESPLLESENAGVGQVVDFRRITDLPLPQSNVLAIMYLAPGVVSGTASLPTSTWELGSTSVQGNVSMAGSRPGTNEFTVDGTPVMSGNNVVFTPFQETVQEFRVQTVPFDAAAGRYSGGHVSIVLKSGANAFHGDAVYTNLTRGLIAKDFFINRYVYDPKTGPINQAKIDSVWPPQRQVSYRIDLNGPVRIPKLYNGKDHTFFMYGFLLYRRVGTVLETDTVPTPAERTGDFSALLKVGSQYQIYDPATSAPSTAGRVSRSPFPGNIIPPNRINPIGQKFLQFWAQPTSPGTVDGTNNLVAANPSRAPNTSHIARLDHAFSDNNRLFASGNITPADANSYSPLSEQMGRRLHRDEYNLSLGDTQIISPSLSFSFRFGLNRFLTRDASPNNGFDITSLGLPASLVAGNSPRFVTIPLVTVTGVTSIGNVAGTFSATTFETYGAEGTYIRGNHQFHLGTEMRMYYSNGVVPGNVSPEFDFNGSTVAGPFSTSAAAPIAHGLASLLLGLPSGGGIDAQPSYAVLSRYHGVFFQDNWKISRRLTLNLGLRYDLDVPMTERYDRAVRSFDFGATLPISVAAQAAYAANPMPQLPASQFSVKGGLQFAGINGSPRGIWNADRNNFSPRVGLAWQVFPKTVLRAGYGIYYLPMGDDQSTITQTGFNQRTALVSSSDNGLTLIGTLNNPFPTGILKAPGASLGSMVSLGQSISFVNPDSKAGQFHKFSVGLQREFAGRVMLDVSYVGNHGIHMSVGKQLDPTPSQYLTRSPVRDQATIDFLAVTFPNPFAGLPGFTGTTLANATLARSQLLKPMPQFGGVVEAFNNGSSSYDALQSRVEKRFSRGLTLQGSLSWSKWIEALSFLNDVTALPDRAVSSFDRPIVIGASGIYELPFGDKKRWLGSNRALSYLVGGWSMQALYQFQSGLPLSFGNIAFVGDIHDIPNSGSDRKVDRWFNTDAGFLKAANQQPSGNIRFFPATFNGVRGQGINNWNTSLSKAFNITEQVKLQFRAEAVDLLNHTTFGVPNTTPTSTAFGQITGVVGGTTQRRITLYFKLSW